MYEMRMKVKEKREREKAGKGDSEGISLTLGERGGLTTGKRQPLPPLPK